MTPTMAMVRVLAVQVGTCAGLNGGRNFLHACVAGRLRQDPAHGEAAVDDREDSGTDGQIQGVIKRHFRSH